MLVAEGEYWGEIESCKPYEKDGDLSLPVRFLVTHKYCGETAQEITPFEATVWLKMFGPSEPYTDQKLDALGYNDVSSDPKFMNSAVKLVCSHYRNKSGVECENWDLAEWGTRPEPSVDALNRADAKRRARKRSMGEPIAKPPPLEPAPEPSPEPAQAGGAPAESPTGDGIPF